MRDAALGHGMKQPFPRQRYERASSAARQPSKELIPAMNRTLRSSIPKRSVSFVVGLAMIVSICNDASAQNRWPSGMSCFYGAQLATKEAWRGSPFGALHGWTGGDTWQNLVGFFDWGVRREFVARRQTHPRVIAISTPLFPTEAKDRFAACARGEYDVHIRNVARLLQRNNAPDAIIRLGWEADGTWFYWSIRGDWQGYKSCFRRWANVLRSVEPRIQMEWAINRQVSVSKAQSIIANAYPGHDVVDIIGFSFYDNWPAATSLDVWRSSFQAELDFWASFARQNRKRLAFGEWGLGDRRGGGFDNTIYVNGMRAFFERNADLIAYESYFDCGSAQSGHRLTGSTLNPVAAGLYRQLW